MKKKRELVHAACNDGPHLQVHWHVGPDIAEAMAPFSGADFFFEERGGIFRRCEGEKAV